MSWRMDRAPDGLPVWSGTDSIFNMEKQAGKSTAFGMGGRCLATALLFLPLIAILNSVDTPGLGPVAMILFSMLLFGGFLLGNYALMPKFMTRHWTLTPTGETLSWEAGDFAGGLDAEAVSPAGSRWRVPLRGIARVETAATNEWQRARDYGRKPFEIPAAEYQAYLFLEDGSRRIIFTANGGREAASTLAHSIRSWLARAKPSAPATPDQREGFDL